MYTTVAVSQLYVADRHMSVHPDIRDILYESPRCRVSRRARPPPGPRLAAPLTRPGYERTKV